MEELLNAGQVYVNGFAVPAAEKADIQFKVNGFVSFYKDGAEWKQSVHKATDGEATFVGARRSFAEGLSKMAGLTVKLSCGEDGFVTRIDFTVKETVAVDKLLDQGNGTLRIDRSSFTLANKPGMPDINNTVFSKENVDPELRAGDLALYWEAADGWHLQRADGVAGILYGGKDHSHYIFNGIRYGDSNITKYSLAKANRPGQFLEARRTLGLFDVEVTAWFTRTGYPFGFTGGEHAREALELGVKNAETARGGIKASADGSDTAASERWMTAEDLAAFDAQLAAAKAALANSSASALDLDRAVYELAVALDRAAQGTKA